MAGGQGQKLEAQRQGLEVRGQGQALVNRSLRSTTLGYSEEWPTSDIYQYQ